MALTLAEGLVNAINTYLAANLTTKLTALDAEYADGIELEAITDTYVGIKSLTAIPNYPALYIISPAGRFRAWHTSGGESKPEVSVGVVVIDADSEALQKRLYRYGRALIELMLEGMEAASLDNWVLSTNEEWAVDAVTAPLTDSADSSFVGEVSLSMRALKMETM